MDRIEKLLLEELKEENKNYVDVRDDSEWTTKTPEKEPEIKKLPKTGA